MLKVEGRESAHLKSRVKDLSVVPNIVSYTPLLAAITPISKLKPSQDNDGNTIYDPVLIRDTESLIATFGDPRVDPEKYIDLYSIMRLVSNGTSCYVAKVPSGSTGVYTLDLNNTDKYSDDPDDAITLTPFGDSNKIFNNSDCDKNIITNRSFTIMNGTDRVANATLSCTKNSDDTTYTVTATLDNAVSASSLSLSEYYYKTEEQSGSSTTESYPEFKYSIDLSNATGAGEASIYCYTITHDSSGYKLNSISFAKEVIKSTSLNNINDNTSVADVMNSVLNSLSEHDVNYNDAQFQYFVKNSYNIFDSTNNEETLSEVQEWLGSKSFVSFFNNLNNQPIVIGYLGNEGNFPVSGLDGNTGTVFGGQVETSSSSPMQLIGWGNEDGKEYWCASDKAYSNLTIKDNNDNIIGSDKYTVAYGKNDGTNGIIVKFKDAQSASSIFTVVNASYQPTPLMNVYSSVSDNINFKLSVSQVKPYSIKTYYLNVAITDKDSNVLATTKVKLTPSTTNQTIINGLNSALNTYTTFELADKSKGSACEILNDGADSIVKALLDKFAPYDDNHVRGNITNPSDGIIDSAAAVDTIERPEFKVLLSDYVNALNQFKDKQFSGCLMADLTAPMNKVVDGEVKDIFGIPSEEDRRTLHYVLKQVACERKDCTVILSTPYTKNGFDDSTVLTLDEICDWTSSNGEYTDHWSYGSTNTTDYAEQSFYLELYHGWMTTQCAKYVDGIPVNIDVLTAPSNLVIDNIMTSYRERGVQYPVAGDQYGVLPDYCTLLNNPKTKLERDQLVQYRINPIYNTGTRGIQIYGNETLNAGYTDLNAAHIARMLVNIRSRIDEYTETLKFSINSAFLWDTWKNYVSSFILDPLKSANGISDYEVKMGLDTTSAEEIANRRVKGIVNLRFYQSAEIFDLDFVVYSSASESFE